MRKVLIFVITISMLFCYGCTGRTNKSFIQATSIDGEIFKIPYPVENATTVPHLTAFSSNNNLFAIKKVIDEMKEEGYKLTSTIYEDTYLLIERQKITEENCVYFLIMDCINDPLYISKNRYLFFNCATSIEGLLLPFHYLPQLGLKNVFAEKKVALKNGQEFETVGSKQDFINFYSKAKNCEITEQPEENAFTLNHHYKFTFQKNLILGW